ncbi:MAG: hypothetical protein NC305_04740 [Lachnospiraceae bacterium]|nr:hypothetical protein [Muribaculum sp.]MCM1409839.1 hypothetical protein [Lachnospiraceae bacterium]
MNSSSNEVGILKEMIKNGSALYYYRATPFTEHGEFNYNGVLKEDFFYDNMFSKQGKCDIYISDIKKSLQNHSHKSILLIGNQGCGKTTFVHNLSRECSKYEFIFFDFDADTSNPTLEEYIERLSIYLLDLLKSDEKTNKVFYNLFIKNKILINQKINANNNINYFFDEFKKTFINEANESVKDDFIKIINALYFNQILSLIILWHLSKFSIANKSQKEMKKLVFCLDNLDVLVNKEIIEKFFREYFRFVRNVDSIIQKLDEDFIKQQNITYNKLFAFVFCCRQHTWARVKEHYRQDNNFVQISTLERNVSDAFDKRNIVECRNQYILDNQVFYGEFINTVERTKSVLSDMDSTEKYQHNIYDLFDDDYRQCNITFEKLLEDNPNLFKEYSRLKEKLSSTGGSLYGARGIIYKALFDKFKQCGIFDDIGVLILNERIKKPLVSNARMILNYLNVHTYSPNKNNQRYVVFEKIVDAFDGIIDKEDIDNALRAMFRLGYDSPWNELIAFNEIHSEEITDCSGLEVFITKAGHEYLSLIATHFEFFNTRISKKRLVNIPLFSEMSMAGSEKYKYNFQETINLVLEAVRGCCYNMSEYYTTVMTDRFESKEEYLQSDYVYSDANVLHGERIIHTHIRYIDTYRLYVLNNITNLTERKEVNEILVEFIEQYIQIGEDYPLVLTQISTDTLFPGFREKIEIIRNAHFEDFTTKIDVKKRRSEQNIR